MYSGPEPPSGGVKRPPFAVMAPHCTQLDGATLTAVGSSGVTVHVTGGDARAMRLLIGQSADQTFAFGSETIFLLWQGKVPIVIDPSKLVVGDKIIVRIRADKGSSLSQVESTPANHIGDREPAAK